MTLGESVGELLKLCGHYCTLMSEYPVEQTGGTIPYDLPDTLIVIQAQWAEALNRADGGHRHAFASFAEWQERLNYLRGLDAEAAMKEAGT